MGDWIPWAAEVPATRSGATEWITMSARRFDWGSCADYAVLAEERLVGGCTLNVQSATRASIGYWLDFQSVGCGYATAASRGLVAIGRTLGIHDLWLRCDKANESSQAVARRLGFALAWEEPHSIDAARQTGTALVFVCQL